MYLRGEGFTFFSLLKLAFYLIATFDQTTKDLLNPNDEYNSIFIIIQYNSTLIHFGKIDNESNGMGIWIPKQWTSNTMIYFPIKDIEYVEFCDEQDPPATFARGLSKHPEVVFWGI